MAACPPQFQNRRDRLNAVGEPNIPGTIDNLRNLYYQLLGLPIPKDSHGNGIAVPLNRAPVKSLLPAPSHTQEQSSERQSSSHQEVRL